jgi:hypothetical protein
MYTLKNYVELLNLCLKTWNDLENCTSKTDDMDANDNDKDKNDNIFLDLSEVIESNQDSIYIPYSLLASDTTDNMTKAGVNNADITTLASDTTDNMTKAGVDNADITTESTTKKSTESTLNLIRRRNAIVENDIRQREEA